MEENTSRSAVAVVDRHVELSTDRSFANLEDKSVTPPITPLRRAPPLVSQAAKSSKDIWRGRLYTLRSFRLPSYGRIGQKFVSKRWYRVSFLAIICIALAPALGVGLRTAVGGSHEPLRVLGLDGQSPREGLFLYGGIRIWDMASKTLSIRWMPHQCGPSYSASADCTGLLTDMLFYTDGNALGIPSFNESNVLSILQPLGKAS
ncbi:hypothetical protein M413DRAFT_124139 [Hebeloma cylindrosporum]|uniref:Uncharacterized protein n=1 Tax=Hebeloma cylindrosporum TaxID=76867 RepID=A0A0C3CF32_HEBCY|nr:hypothetical protein M413DRAFT_124139 [Hebeloma cylindrosporum h7]